MKEEAVMVSCEAEIEWRSKGAKGRVSAGDRARQAQKWDLALAKGAFLVKNLTPLTILLGEYIILPSISGIVSFLMDGNVSK